MAFKNIVIMAAEVWDTIGYLEGTIQNPATLIKPADTTNSKTTSIITTKSKDHTIDVTFWDSNKPTTSKWRVRNAWSKRLLLCNIRNLIELGADVSSTTALQQNSGGH